MMPDPHAQARQRYLESLAEMPTAGPHFDAEAVAHCPMCDAEGYRGGTVCDHVDRVEVARRGIAACRAVLDQKKAGKQ